MTETKRPELIEATISGKGLPLAVHGLPYEVDANSTVRVSPSGHISVAIPGDPLGHVLVRCGFEVMEAALDVATATKLAQLLRGEVDPKKEIPAPPTTSKKRRPFKWVPTALTGPVFVEIGHKVYRVPSDAQIRYNGAPGPRSLAYVKVADRVHLLGAAGEAVLTPDEATALARRWDKLVIGN